MALSAKKVADPCPKDYISQMSFSKSYQGTEYSKQCLSFPEKIWAAGTFKKRQAPISQGLLLKSKRY